LSAASPVLERNSIVLHERKLTHENMRRDLLREKSKTHE
jgi:hypothetical protein